MLCGTRMRCRSQEAGAPHPLSEGAVQVKLRDGVSAPAVFLGGAYPVHLAEVIKNRQDPGTRFVICAGTAAANKVATVESGPSSFLHVLDPL